MNRRAAIYTVLGAIGFDLIGALWFAAVEHLSVATGITPDDSSPCW